LDNVSAQVGEHSIQFFLIGYNQSVPHVCTPECECKIGLDAAVIALTEASQILSASIVSGSDEIIEARFASVRMAWVKVTGALAAYRDHFADA
jgi:hypothetical protein